MHTTSGILGYDYPVGDIDFYPNGGTFQNGCATDSSCSHIYSYVFYAESINAEATGAAQFVGTACESYEDAIVMACNGARDAVFGGLAVKTRYFKICNIMKKSWVKGLNAFVRTFVFFSVNLESTRSSPTSPSRSLRVENI